MFVSCLSTEKQSSYFSGQLVFPAGLGASDGGCVIDIANQGQSGLDQYEVREAQFNQDLTCSLLGEQRSVKWHNSLKVQADTYTYKHTEKRLQNLLCASLVHSFL